jgi:hypothetical protein
MQRDNQLSKVKNRARAAGKRTFANSFFISKHVAEWQSGGMARRKFFSIWKLTLADYFANDHQAGKMAGPYWPRAPSPT